MTTRVKMAGTMKFQYPLDHAKNFTLFFIAPKKNKRLIFLSTMHPQKETNADNGKEETNVFYNQEKVDADRDDQMCSFYNTARKINS